MSWSSIREDLKPSTDSTLRQCEKKMKLCKLYDIPEVVLTLGFSSSAPTPDQDLTFNICKAVGNLVHQG